MRIVILLVFMILSLIAESNKATTIEAIAKKYIWGGESPKGFDCSGQYIYKQVGINLPRTALLQSKVGEKIKNKPYKKGDLLFFLTDRTRGIPITHVGIYLEDNKFIHAASTSKGIIISDLTSSKYCSLLVSVSRVLTKEQREMFQPKFFSKALKQYLSQKIPLSHLLRGMNSPKISNLRRNLVN